MERGGMRGGRAAWHQPRTSRRFIRATQLFVFTISQLGLPRSRGALCAPAFAFLFVPDPERGVGGAPRGALLVRSRLRSATTVLARHGPSRLTGRRLSALHRSNDTAEIM